jgi:hypothetical protein
MRRAFVVCGKVIAMFQRELTETYTCPTCGGKLKTDNGELRCDEHGLFFAYSPQLIVRAPEKSEQLPRVALPWENNSAAWV